MQVNSRVWNLGDTSFRRKRLLDDYIELLKVLDVFNSINPNWDKDAQKAFHLMVLKETELFQETTVKKGLDRRARTMTSALNKIGLCDKERNITEVGLDLLNLDKDLDQISKDDFVFKLDDIEKRLNISRKNILFLRQMLKFRIFNSTEEESFNPFLIALSFFAEYDYLEDEHFKKIIQNLYFGQDYKEIVKKYKLVRSNDLGFDEYLKDNLLKDLEEVDNESDDSVNKVLEFQRSGTYFRDIFTNRKTPESVTIYEGFYNSLKLVREDMRKGEFVKANIKELLEFLRNDRIKTAFISNEIFDLPTVGSKDQDLFIEKNKDNYLLICKDNEFREKLYSIFISAKTNNLIYEYYDVTVRTFNLTGVLDFSNGRVRISKKYLNDLIKHNKAILLDLVIENKYENEESYNKIFYSNKSSMLEILNIDHAKLELYNSKLMEKNNIKNIDELDNYYLELEDKLFIEFIDDRFSNETLIQILRSIRERNDSLVYELVTDNANIPTIFEYIMGITWYRISSSYEEYSILDSLNLSLDGSFLPLSHAVGGDGDIIINYKDHILMLEVTLMDLSNQRRNELEPVIRHTTNLAIKNPEKPVLTLFIANEIDYNTSSIFRLCSFLNLKSTTGSDEYTNNGIQIFSFMINEIINILDENISYESIYNNLIEEFKGDKREIINSSWRKKVVEKIM